MDNRRKNLGGHGGGMGAGSDPKEKMRTHMMFMTQTEKEPKKKVRRKVNEKYQQQKTAASSSAVQEKDVGVQTPPLLDPTQWTGNQRVVHFGPMAQRDPFYYYYPKGWDILYPAHFGFFPYRTKTSRGSSPIICLISFGVFFTFGGATMTYLGYSNVLRDMAVGTLQPLKVAGPILLTLGCLFLLMGSIWWLFSLQLCNEHLRHTQPHHVEPRKVFVKEAQIEEIDYNKSFLNKSPYLPPPPIPVLANAHTELSLYKPTAEMKLYPPVIPGATSTLSLPRSTISYNTQYNTLSSAYGIAGGAGESAMVYDENEESWPEYHAGNIAHYAPERSNKRQY